MKTVSGKYILPDWPAVPHIKAVSTTRLGGCSEKPYDSFNLGVHVNDNPEFVEANRNQLLQELQLPAAPKWLDQVHGIELVYCDQASMGGLSADAAWTDQPGCVLSVMTADCLPVLLASESGDIVAVVHGGWRGLVDGILQKTVAELPVLPGALRVWFGPAIGPASFEVGSEVREAFLNQNSIFQDCFIPSSLAADKYFGNIFKLAEHCLRNAGVTQISGGGICTFNDKKRFFSHRRDHGATGRMASLIWISSSH